MKIVILMGSLTMGGAERVATTLASYLSKHDVDTYLISFDENESSYFIEPSVHFINNKDCKKKGKFKGIKQRINFLFHTLDKIKPDLIFTMFCITNVYALLYKFFHDRKIKVVSSERCNPKAKDRKGIKEILNRFSSAKCDGFIFQTEKAQKCYPKKVQKKSIVIHNAVSNPMLNEVDTSTIMTKKIISSMGRLEEQKAQDIMIKAFEPIAQSYPEYKLIIYGEGSKREELERLIKELNLQKNVFLPGNDEKAILKVAQSQIFILTSRFEGMPNALIEAMALGIPSISTDCDMGPSELINSGENGYLVAVDDVNDITNKLELLINDNKLRNFISENSRKINETHSIDKIYRKYLEYFKKIVGGKNEKENI